jgi:hypothetical protein
MKSRVILLLAVVALAVSLLGLSSSYGNNAHAQVAEDPTIVGAGDIGNCSSRGDEATATLIDGIDGTVFTLGDNAYPNGSDSDFARCYDPTWGRFKARTMPALGNHEYYTSAAKPYFDYFGASAGDPARGYYSYDLGEWHVVVLNSNCSLVAGGCATGSAQEQWLKTDLADNPGACTLAYWHDPRFSSGVNANNVSVGSFWNALYQAGADVVLNGHNHAYERFAPQNPVGQGDPARGIREFVVGTGGGAFNGFNVIKPNSEVRIANANGVLKMTLHPEGYDWQFVTAPTGTVADSGSGICSVDAPSPSPIDATAPTVQAPLRDLPTGSTLGTSTVPTRISWSATDDQSGIAGYELQQSVNGSTFKGVGLSSTTSTTKTLQLQPGNTYQFRVRATDGAGNTSDWTSDPSFALDTQQESSTGIVYAGSWTQQAVTSAYGGGVKYASANESAAQFTFSGQNVAWVATKGPNRGKAAISVDGMVLKTLDLYASATQPRKVVFSMSTLDPTISHTTMVQVLGTKRIGASGTSVDVDAFVVLK